ncbi:MAG: Smr/MutS family protein [Bdellovibrionales bacterium]|nr:Smr/MutS family protein [Bdellovibrionales bacterium]
MKIGDAVRIKSLKKKGVILSFIKDTSAMISLGSVSIKIPLTDLELLDAKSNKKGKKRKLKEAFPYKKTTSLDLHGSTQSEAKARLEKCINDSILQNIDQIEVIHGKGSGKVKQAVWKLAEALDVIKSIREDTSNPGVSWIYL